MKFWHPFIFRKLKRPQLVELFDDVCEMRKYYSSENNKGVPEHVEKGSYEQLCAYYILVVKEMKRRNIQYAKKWDDLGYRGEIEHELFGLIPVARMVTNPNELQHFIESGNPYPAWCTRERYCKQLTILQKTKKVKK